jgi:drug/metabolite transporter (DMT)-like permease|tara:strand:+ start:3256 stop:4152 length:897 start_codon:yes stop_codon:yes gene_type:complete
MNNRNLGLLAAFGATLIYGFNHTIAKNLMPTYIGPFAFILLRVLGAAILFWILSIFFKNEKIDKKDWPRIILCSFLGMVINMLAFFKGLELSTPINSSVLITVVPIFVFVFSAIIIKERVSLLKVVGISAGFFGALILILKSPSTGYNAPDIPTGNLLFVLNSSTYGLYLIFVKPLVEKYNIITLFRWLFLFGFLMNFPLTVSEFSSVDWLNLPFYDAILPMLYVVVGTTFFTYLFNAYALTQLKASTVSSFIYLQPIVGIIYALTTKNDSLTLVNVIGMVLIFVGVYLVTKKIEQKI